MASVACPHCGERNFTIEGWADLDRCSRCGKSLARRGPRPIKDLRPINAVLREYRLEMRFDTSTPIPHQKEATKVTIGPGRP